MKPLLVFVLAAGYCMQVSCGQGSDPSDHQVDLQHEPITQEPYAVTKLRALNNGIIQFNLSINGSEVVSDLSADDQQTPITLSEADFDSTINDIQLSFLFRSNDGSTYPLASAQQSIPRPNAGDRIILSGLFYRYADSDNDGLYNVSELAIKPVDIDNDSLDNVNDPDSDGDGLEDGVDPDPYNTGFTDTPGSALQFDLIYPDEQTEKIDIYEVTGLEEEVLHLVNTLGSTDLVIPSLWPADQDPLGYSGKRWKAFGLGNGPLSLCPDFRIGIDASSFKSSLSTPALLYFRRIDTIAQMLPIGADLIPSLDGYLDGELDNGLKILLVPENSVGWIEMWTQQNYMGEVCTLNLSTFLSN